MTEGRNEIEVWGSEKRCCFVLRAGLEENGDFGPCSRWCGPEPVQSLSLDCSAITSLLARYSSEKKETDARPAISHFFLLIDGL